MSDAEHDRLSDQLADWIRRSPDAWPSPGETEMSDTRVEEILAGILASKATPFEDTKRRRRRRRRIIGGGCVIVVVTGGAVAAAALLRSGQPEYPNAGATCRAEVRLGADAIVLDPGADPLNGCRALWSSGRFEEFVDGSTVPPLTACIGPGGGVEVFPGETFVCVDLGLVAADSTLNPENQAIVDLQDRLVVEINAAACVPVEQAAVTAQKILSESLLRGWTVSVAPGSLGGPCGKVAVDSTTKVIVVNQL